MFSNIGRKIKGLASIICGLGMFASIIIGVALMCIAASAYDEIGIIVGILVIIIGIVVSWVCSFFMYGFGELIDKTCDIEMIMKERVMLQDNNCKVDKMTMLIEWREKGLITEEEFQKKKVQMESI